MNLTRKQKDAMHAVRNGADVLSPAIARELRDLEKIHPDLIRITEVKGDYDPRGHLPYFGAILTDAGREALGIKGDPS